jgi:hypothetical protein
MTRCAPQHVTWSVPFAVVIQMRTAKMPGVLVERNAVDTSIVRSVADRLVVVDVVPTTLASLCRFRG